MKLKTEVVSDESTEAVEAAPLEETKATAQPAPATTESSKEAEMVETDNTMPTQQSSPIDRDLFLDEGKKSPSKKGLFLVVVLIALAVALVSGGIMVYRRTMSSQSVVSDGTPVEGQPGAETTPVVETTPVPELDRAELKVEILNGSGTPGFAGKAKEYLEGLGYVDVETGNASSYDYDETEIAIKEGKEEFLDMLKEDLVERYVVAAKTTTLGEDSDYDAVITLGSDEALASGEATKTSPTPSVKATKSPTPTPKTTKSPTPTPKAATSPTPTPEE